jgi:CRISPR-associated endonuclease/helicase Cas3
MLSPGDFAAFFEEIHGYAPFPWQERLLRQVAEIGDWPRVLDLPTGSGKTAAIDVAVFHLALEADRGETRRASVRIAFVVDRRLAVDDAFARAQQIANALLAPRGTVTRTAARRLTRLAGDGPALVVRRLRGGIPHEDDWVRTPSQPTVLCSTVDQIGSRLLFRGYGVSDSMKPVHAGLIGSDCLILLDEAHLAEPFRQTLEWVRLYRGETWREVKASAPWGVALLTATPAELPQGSFSLADEDRIHPVLKTRLAASKPVRLIARSSARGAKTEDHNFEDYRARDDVNDLVDRMTVLAEEVERALKYFQTRPKGILAPAIAVVVNRVARARAVFHRLTNTAGAGERDFLLLIGPARPLERDDVAAQLAPIRTGADRYLQRPLVVVATQCIEAGVDIDLDALISEVAPLDALRQRFGRLNRSGRNIRPYGAIVAMKSDLSGHADDPVYGAALGPAWDRLVKAAGEDGREWVVEFGPSAFAVPLDACALSPKPDAPVLLPAHLDLLSQTAPIPAADPDIALYLHGPARQPDSVTVVWRADITPEFQADEDVRRLLLIAPPRASEAIELPLWAVREWLNRAGNACDLADAAMVSPSATVQRPKSEALLTFRWKGDTESSRWITPGEAHPGDTVVAPATYGGVDEFGWNPRHTGAVKDLYRRAAWPFAGRRFILRVAPGLLNDSIGDAVLADALAGAASRRWPDLRAALLDLSLPDVVREDLVALDNAKRGKVMAYLDLYGFDGEGRPRGVVFIAPLGITNGRREEDGLPNATEDDTNGSMPGYRLTLVEHSGDVETKAEAFAIAAGLPKERVVDLTLAGFLHDLGKGDPRFQAWLQYGDPLGPDPDDPRSVLAKSDRPIPRGARTASGLPYAWRHEALSVRLAPHIARFTEAVDPDLVLWLVGCHHGHGRPLFPHSDGEDSRPRNLPGLLGIPTELPSGWGPESLAYEWQGLDWSALFARLKTRYGVWELARMEAILRLADHRASEESAVKENRA